MNPLDDVASGGLKQAGDDGVNTGGQRGHKHQSAKTKGESHMFNIRFTYRPRVVKKNFTQILFHVP